MPYVVGELYGHAQQEAQREARDPGSALRRAQCPFSQRICDGGGNRDMMRIPANDETLGPLLHPSIGGKTGGFLPCGVCTVRSTATGQMWAVCPRRLFSFGGADAFGRHRKLATKVLMLAGFLPGEQVRIWSEITLKERGPKGSSFDYRLDYVVRGTSPQSPPIIIEVMTCSTSGGNRAKGTDMKMAFRRAVLAAFKLRDGPPESPGVNIRQVWARMASQLIAKSEAALAWGGKTIWIVQDLLADYMRTRTALPLDRLRSPDWQASEVNLVVSDLQDAFDLYSGPIRPSGADRHCWMEILGAPHVPALESLERKLASNESAVLTVPHPSPGD
ncbi:MAG: hypothetical protein OXE48_00990 [Gammaproteobacteria bacterium]|nr:hypothetical protein [Gammaproteobacteria bacterium]